MKKLLLLLFVIIMAVSCLPFPDTSKPVETAKDITVEFSSLERMERYPTTSPEFDYVAGNGNEFIAITVKITNNSNREIDAKSFAERTGFFIELKNGLQFSNRQELYEKSVTIMAKQTGYATYYARFAKGQDPAGAEMRIEFEGYKFYITIPAN